MNAEYARLTLFIRLALMVLFAAMLWKFASFVAIGARAFAWPFALNYGEGIVWEQALLLSEGRGYGPIDEGLPAIVFHYTPLYTGKRRCRRVGATTCWGGPPKPTTATCLNQAEGLLAL